MNNRFNHFESPATQGNEYRKVAAWFLGPKGENESEFQDLVKEAVKWHSQWRRDYFPQDNPYIDDELKRSEEFKEQIEIIRKELLSVSSKLKNSIPFFSSRYKGHMNWDVSMIGILGYFATSLFNPNNVATEGSPVTTHIEYQVGKQLCKMLGFNSETLKPWGHITSCGTVSNIESLWAARNVKYLPIIIKKAILGSSDFESAKGAKITTAQGETKEVVSLSDWELLNIPVDYALKLQLELVDVYKIRKEDVARVLAEYDIQHLGMASFTQGYYIVPVTRHYSWDKAGAVLGIGQSNMKMVPIDRYGRLDISLLREQLRVCLTKKIPVIQVVLIAGSTSEGAVDPIDEVVNLREEFRKKGLDFYIHVDAAWGGYFCTMLPTETRIAAFRDAMIPFLPLNSYTQRQLRAISRCDSCTVDPHKSGFIQYGTGGLCYRNNYIRFLLAFEAPVISNVGSQSDASIGTYGIEGSKPGAAVVATYLHHEVVGLHQNGHGRILGQTHFTAKKIYALLATMADANDPFKIALYHPLGDVNQGQLLKIVNSSNDEIFQNRDLMQLLSDFGPDLNINAFTINFSWPILQFDNVPRTVNTSQKKMQELIATISEELNMSSLSDTADTTTPKGASRKSLFVIRNTLTRKNHKAVIESLQQELGIITDLTDEMPYLVNTNMDPWPTATGFLESFRFELRQSIFRGIGAIMEEKHNHGFVVTDSPFGDEVFGNHLPVFTEAQHNYHLVVKLKFQSEESKASVMKAYQEKLLKQPDQLNKPMIIGNINKNTLHDIIKSDYWEADVFCGFPDPRNAPFAKAPVIVSDVLINEHFDPKSIYPVKDEYFIYGSTSGVYMSHCMYKKPDYHHVVSLSQVEPPINPLLLELGFKSTIDELPGGFKSHNPFQLEAPYHIEYIGIGGKKEVATIRVTNSVWFDVEHLNVTHHHQAPVAEAISVETSSTRAVIFEAAE